LPEVPSEYIKLAHQSEDGSGWVLLYIGQAQKTSETRHLGVRCTKHCGKHSYEGQSPLRLGLCGILRKRMALDPYFIPKQANPSVKFVYLDGSQNDALTHWCDENVLMKYIELPRETSRSLDKDEKFQIRQLFPLLNTEHSNHPFAADLEELIKRFLEAGESRPRPEDSGRQHRTRM
jgi:hypothetical protein